MLFYETGLLTNATVVGEAVRFVSEYSNNKKVIFEEGNGKESKEEPDYNEDKDQLEGEQEKETGEITMMETTATTNYVF